MDSKRFVVIGAGEVGTYLAGLLSQAGHAVVVVEADPDRAEAVGSLLTRRPMRDIELPPGSLIVALERAGEVIVPGGADQAAPGDDALVLALTR